jgi:integrase
MASYAGDVLRPINKVDVSAVCAALAPIWLKKPETAMRLRGRIERILDAAKVQGLRDGENPARWKGNLEHLMPGQPAKRTRVRHHPALPYAEVPGFLEELSSMEGLAPIALRFAILTAVRHGEARGARWNEIDLDAAVWTIPASRMKAQLEHRVPLSDAPLALLRPLAELRYTPYVFPSPKRLPMTHTVFAGLLRRMGRSNITTHGFRTSFRTWAAERTSFAREVCEACLAHTNADQTEAAYQRSDLLELRIKLMAAWGSFCTSPISTGDVIPMWR